jgi:hypothetical protein
VRAEEARAHAEFHAPRAPRASGLPFSAPGPGSGSTVGSAFGRASSRTVANDYLCVLSTGTGPFPNISAEDVEQGIERFAAALPAKDRIVQLLSANPLHIDRRGTVGD